MKIYRFFLVVILLCLIFIAWQRTHEIWATNRDWAVERKNHTWNVIFMKLLNKYISSRFFERRLGNKNGTSKEFLFHLGLPRQAGTRHKLTGGESCESACRLRARAQPGLPAWTGCCFPLAIDHFRVLSMEPGSLGWKLVCVNAADGWYLCSACPLRWLGMHAAGGGDENWKRRCGFLAD